MNFRIAYTFTTSLARLTDEEQKAAKTTAFDLQMDPAGKGKSFHKLDRARDPNFWSVRVNRDIRLIVHRAEGSLLLCYVDHHDDAYDWVERRKLEVHPTTGAAQLVEIRERVEEIPVPVYVEAAHPAAPPALAGFSAKQLLAYGVPEEWLADVMQADEDRLLELVEHLPSEAAEAVLELATGGTPTAPMPIQPGEDPFQHPDAQRRFRVMADAEELSRALEYPWDKWTVFLHPSQRQMVERDYNGPARVSGSAGTGKTVVALHRTVYLARANEDARVLLVTFSDTLANALRASLFRLVWNTPKLVERIDVHAMDAIALRLYTSEFGKPSFASDDDIKTLLQSAATNVEGVRNSPAFLHAEWQGIVDTWQIKDWPGYRDVPRLGRKTRLPEAQRALLWEVLGQVIEQLDAQGKITRNRMYAQLAEAMAKREHPVFDHVVVDEAQDIGVHQLRFLAAITGDRPNGLFFAGDLGQRIFQQPFSWRAQGVDVRGRSRTLKINYRTSHQIRTQADRLLGAEVGDVDGNVETRKGTVSVFNGPDPVIHRYRNQADEIRGVGDWLRKHINAGVAPHEMGVFVRSADEIRRAEAAVLAADLQPRVLDRNMATEEGQVSITTMHLAKGMEFKVVAVMACDDEVIPSQPRIESAADEVELTEIYETERHLLYVACTRARDALHVSAVDPASEFLEDLLG